MKNNRGAALQSVRSAMWKVFGSEWLPSLKSNTKASIIVKWKENPKIGECHRLLFETNSENVFWISAIARATFFGNYSSYPPRGLSIICGSVIQLIKAFL